MSKANELVKAIEDFMIENGVNPRALNTAKEWNECLGTNYSPATYTSAVKQNLLERRKGYKETAYSYRLNK